MITQEYKYIFHLFLTSSFDVSLVVAPVIWHIKWARKYDSVILGTWNKSTRSFEMVLVHTCKYSMSTSTVKLKWRLCSFTSLFFFPFIYFTSFREQDEADINSLWWSASVGLEPAYTHVPRLLYHCAMDADVVLKMLTLTKRFASEF